MDDKGLTNRLWRLKWDVEVEDKDKHIAEDVTSIVVLVLDGRTGVKWDQRTKAMLERTEQRLTKNGIRALYDQR